jgi:hypothetical protein
MGAPGEERQHGSVKGRSGVSVREEGGREGDLGQGDPTRLDPSGPTH